MTDWLSTSSTILSGLFNAKRSNTNKWRAARGSVQAGIRNARLLCIGNSITAGYNATGNTSLNNMASKAYPTQLAQVLSGRGLTASWQSWIGGNNYADFNAADNRISMGSWANSGLGTFGGNVLTKSTLGGSVMSFTPLTPVDTVVLIGVRNNSTVAITVAVDGGAVLSTYNPYSSGSFQLGVSAPISLGSLGAHTIQSDISTATLSFLGGMIAYNSAAKEVSVLRAGWHGALASFFNNVNWTYTDGVKAVAPDLSLIAVTRNDAASATDLTAFSSSYQQIITAAKVSGDVILVIEPLGNLSTPQYSAYVDALFQLARTNDIPLIDFTVLWDAYSNTTTWYGDTIHPTGFAYGEKARQIGELLMLL